MKIKVLQARAEHCDALWILGVHEPPTCCPDDMEAVVAAVIIDMPDELATPMIEAHIAWAVES